MNKLNYLLLLFLSLFVLMSIVIKPKSFENYFRSDIDVTIPEESLSKDFQKKQSISFDIEAFTSASEEEKELTAQVESITGWTIEVEEYENKESLMDDFRILKSRGLKAYIRYKDNEDNKFILYVGPTIDRDDSRDNLTKISDLTRFSPKIIPYD
ncbi:MAG TPA: SPOR domain-containing protein [SAR86 cluster bacterium]|nr:SPOR domain-containing protein [SAR86 cluster bacterium]HJM14797.1 SPOR domain-containing protein [SAR86 cluster bacterium]|tara:strand:+ start:5257 stop:5721 length:465 start_codon:yes stop_codon:yes gene_type:complete